MTAAALGAVALCGSLRAQDVAADNEREGVIVTISRLADAANRGDVRTVKAMFSYARETVAIVDGVVYQGADDIGDHLQQVMEERGRLEFRPGTMNVASLHAAAIATGPYDLRIRDEAHRSVFHGAVTLVMVRHHGRWIVAHMHRSLAAADE